MLCPNTIRKNKHRKETFSGNESTFLGEESTFLGSNIPILHTIGGRAYPVRHYPLAIRLRTREEYAILCIALNPQSGDFSGAILEVPFKALLHGVLSVVGRCSLGRNRQGIREVKEMAILIKSTFSISAFFGRSLVCPWFILGY